MESVCSLGQTGVIVNARVRNAGNADVQIDSLRLIYDGSITHGALNSVLQTSPLPLLSTGESFIATYASSAASVSVDTGFVVLDLRAYGTDQNSQLPIDTLNSEQTDSINI